MKPVGEAGGGQADTSAPQPLTIGERIVQNLNVYNAKKIALSLVVGFTVYHGLIHYLYGPDSCNWLLWDGRFQGRHIWQPYGCMMHKYSREDARNCMRYNAYWGITNNITFIGDSRIRQVYSAFVSHFLQQNQHDTAVTSSPADKHSDKLYTDADADMKLSVQFVWSPMVNGSMAKHYTRWNKMAPNLRPRYVITGSGTWAIKERNGSDLARLEFEKNLTDVVPAMNGMGVKTTILWMLQDPVVIDKLDEKRKMISNQQIDKYNKVAMDVLESSGVRLWKSSRLVAQGLVSEQSSADDGLHIADLALQYDVQILLNAYCNDEMNFNDGTCCSSREPVTIVQIVVAAIFLTCGFVAVVMTVYKRNWERRMSVSAEPSPAAAETAAVNGTAAAGAASKPKPKVLAEDCESVYLMMVTVAKLGLIMAYFFLCDRTNFFMKENKYYTHLNFFLPFGYVTALGLFFTEETKQTTILHRDMTDEWKGWMQLVILIYHMTGASQVLPIYMHIRVLVSAYLFLTGFGHFYYFWQKGDYGLYRLCQSVRQAAFSHCKILLRPAAAAASHPFRSSRRSSWPISRHDNSSISRVISVLFRMNLLVVTLCVVMNRPYQFYYFVPLVSFWFLVVYATMAMLPHITSTSAEGNPTHYFYMVLKLVAVTAIITVLYMSEVLFEKIFVTRPWKALFVDGDDSIREWWFRWQLDRYSIVYGMGFAYLCYLLKKFKVLDDSTHDTLFSRALTALLCLAALLGVVSYGVFTGFCRNKPQCNEVHSYIAFIPILSFVVLRNVPGCMRSRYSTFFAWFGKISLELFISQYHIWLAADTHGILVLIPGYPVLNVCITSFVFVCVAHEISKITGILVPFIVPSNWKCLLRNIIVFFLLLIPLGTARGMFG